MKTGNAGPILHWRLWQKNSIPSLLHEQYFLADNKHDGDMLAKRKLCLAYCLYIRPIFKAGQPSYRFDPICSSTEAGPPFAIAICREYRDAIHEGMEISRPVYSIYNSLSFACDISVRLIFRQSPSRQHCLEFSPVLDLSP